jgi:hypothetical protein
MPMSSDGLIFYYGSYEHPKGEVSPTRIEIRPLFTDEGIRWAQDVRVEIEGSFVNQSPELDSLGVDARIIELEDVYGNDYQDFGFNLSDGTPTDHYLLTDDLYNLSGNHVMHFGWENRFPTEFANTRSFRAVLGARYLSPYEDIIYFHETVQKIGTGGERWRLYNRWNGDPVKETIMTQSKVYHVQRGTVVGLASTPTIPGPLWPDDEQVWRRTITRVSPRHHGDLSFLKATHYAVSYAYFFERIGVDDIWVNPYYIP